MPFLPLYVERPGATDPQSLNLWSGVVFSMTFLFSAIASPFWDGLPYRKGRKIMLLRSAPDMVRVMVLMGRAAIVLFNAVYSWRTLRHPVTRPGA